MATVSEAMGDGELNEGQCWEAFQFIANYRLGHCIVIIDENKKQLDGPTKEVMRSPSTRIGWPANWSRTGSNVRGAGPSVMASFLRMN